MEENLSINTLYQYTEFTLKAQEESLNRIDAKSNSFIGFSSILIRLAIDIHGEKTKIAVFVFAILSIILGTIGLIAKKTGASLHPQTLLMDEYINEGELTHKFIIIKDQISLLNEYEKLMKYKRIRTNSMIICFCIGMVFYGLGVIGYGETIIELVYK
jgi:hypothetical protein